MKVTIFGIGYVGLVQGTVLASVGHDVVCVDIDEQKVIDLKRGIIPIYEPGLSSIVEENYDAQRLKFTCDIKEAVEHGEFIFIAVGTPPDEDGSADLKYVLSVAESVAQHMQTAKIIVNKSTVPVGTVDKVKEKVTDVQKSLNHYVDFSVVSNPEFLKEGAAVNDCLKPDRIIIGTLCAATESKMRELYAPFNRNHDKIIVMDERSAELTKYAANCMLATKISFMNEMSNLAEKLGADIEAVRHGIGSDPRIGYQFIYPGCGYGGSCFPKDVQALIKTANDIEYQPAILEAVEAVNLKQKNKLYDYLSKHFGDKLSGRTVALWGLSFKPNTDDMREASSRVLMESLWENKVIVQAFDPEAMTECSQIYPQQPLLKLTESKEEALQGADVLVICTEWRQFRAPDFDMIARTLKDKVIIDGRNMYEPVDLKNRGFSYYAIGRGESVAK